MNITSFNPLIITKNPEPTIQLFEELGFKRHHTKKNIGDNEITDVRMEDANGFNVDVAEGDGEWTAIRINVDDFDEAIAFFMDHGFRKPRHEQASKTTDTGSSKFTMLVAPSGFLVTISKHIKNHD